MGGPVSKPVTGARPGKLLERRAPQGAAPGELAEAAEGPIALALCHELAHLAARHALDVAQTQAHAPLLHGALHLGGVDVDAQHRYPAVLRLVHEAVWGVEAHRLLVQERTQELRAVVDAQPRRLIGEQAERGTVGLGEAEAREALDHLPHALGALECGA